MNQSLFVMAPSQESLVLSMIGSVITNTWFVEVCSALK